MTPILPVRLLLRWETYAYLVLPTLPLSKIPLMLISKCHTHGKDKTQTGKKKRLCLKFRSSLPDRRSTCTFIC